MTANQINYARLLEERRSHITQEGETQRSNLAKEQENRRANDLKYAADIYGINVSAETSRRNAELNYWAQMRSIEEQAIWRQREVNEQIRHNQEVERLTESGQSVQRETAHISAGASILNNVIGSITKLAVAVG